MARLARADLVDPAEVAAFLCSNRCVRRYFLCGDNPCTGRNYDHRKVWLEDRLKMTQLWLPLATRFGWLFQRVAGAPLSITRLKQRGRHTFRCRDAQLLAAG